jgi:hypothetical protein
MNEQTTFSMKADYTSTAEWKEASTEDAKSFAFPSSVGSKTSEALAEAFSSSLASIAVESIEKVETREHPNATKTDGGADSSSGKSSDDPAVVTTNMTASSSEDRPTNNNSSSSDDRPVQPVHSFLVARLPAPNTDATSSSGSGGEADKNEARAGKETASLEQRNRESASRWRAVDQFLTDANKSSDTDSSGDHTLRRKSKHSKRQKTAVVESKTRKRSYRGMKKGREKEGDGGSSDENSGSSGSGTEGGYAGSASSSEAAQLGSCSSPSVSSSGSICAQRKHAKCKSTLSGDPNRPMLSKKQARSLSESSEIADFSSESESPSITSFQVSSAAAQDQPRRKGMHISDTKPAPTLQGKPPIMSVGCDVMAHVLTFLEPPDVLNQLTAPLSKDWLATFTRQSELWRVLSLLEPFKAQLHEDSDDGDSSDSFPSYPFDVESQLRQTFGKFRLLYTSFVRCMRYLAQIKDDATNGRAPTMIDYVGSSAKMPSHDITSNHNLHHFLARARGVVQNGSRPSVICDISDEPLVIADDGSSTNSCRRKRRNPKASELQDTKRRKLTFGPSKITKRLLGPTASGEPGNVDLPWSCAIYSIVNWMAAFSDVEGIQTMCLKVLPLILENEQHRITAQRAGLTDIVLRGMVLFPDCAQLHTAAFHTIVLLARPLGGQEGMLFHTSMVNASGIFDKENGSQGGKNGIAVMLDSMRRFQHDGVLQAMSCWSLVNIALAPSQKQVLVKLGGIEATANAMMSHPHKAEVQVSN